MNRLLARASTMRIPTCTRIAVLSCCYMQAAAFAPLTCGPRSFTSSLTTAAASKKDQSFPTWSFDSPCTSMEWSKLVPTKLELGDVEASDLVIVGVSAPAQDEDKEEGKEDPAPVSLTGAAKTLDDELSGALTELLAENAKKFKNGATLGAMTPTLRVVGGSTKRVVLMGLGTDGSDDEPKDWSGAGFSLGKAVAEQCGNEKKIASCKVILPADVTSNATMVGDFSSSFYQTLYADNRYRTGEKIDQPAEDLETVTISTDGEAEAVDPSVLEDGRLIAQGIALTKDIVNAPHNVLNSLSLADTAKRIAKESGGSVTCTILGKKECEKLGMGAYLGVARGSETEPQFIHLTYKAKGDNLKKVGIVGKGLLFDTGGYNIKTAMMELMKFDCGGSAAVLGAARAIAALKPPGVEAHFVIAACSNMINQKAMVPSDILTASNGKTIEVLNTDAEGRLTLADALVYADKEVGCEKIVELSTLTGACMISLGQQIAGVWTSNDDLASELEGVSKVTGDKVWRMPMAKEYAEQLESKIADISNLGGKYGGAITAALFLENFVDAKKPFAHVDIAGPVWSDKIGATGFGAKLVTEWVTQQGQSSD